MNINLEDYKIESFQNGSHTKVKCSRKYIWHLRHEVEVYMLCQLLFEVLNATLY